MRLTIWSVLFAIFITATAGNAAAEKSGANLLPNPSFEEVVQGKPRNVRLEFPEGKPSIEVDAGVAHSGTNSMRLTATNTERAVVGNRVLLSGGKTYRFSAWYKTTSGVNPKTVTLRLMFFKSSTSSADADKVPLTPDMLVGPVEGSLRPGLHNHIDGTLDASQEWRRLCIVARIPDNVLSVNFQVFNWKGNGTVWIDDVAIEQVELDAEDLAALAAGASAAEEEKIATQTRLADHVPAGHPRVMLRPDELADFHASFAARDNLMWNLVLKDKVLPIKMAVALPSEFKAARLANNAAAAAAWRASYTAAAAAGEQAEQLALAYLVTGDKWYAEQAERLMAHLMRWDMNSTITVNDDDETFVQMLHPLLFAYDWVAPALTPEGRAVIRAGLDVRLNALYNKVKAQLSLTQVPSYTIGISHSARQVSTLALGGLALYGETPKAAEILAWAYTYYTGQFTPWGGDSGGWSEGPSYWTTALTGHIVVADAFNAIGLPELYERPWYRQTGYFGLYVLPPFTHANLGDIANFITPGSSQFMHLRRLAQVYQDPYLARYGELLGPQWPAAFSYNAPSALHSVFALYRERKQPVPKGRSLAELPQSRWFKDIHWVAIHSKLDEPKNDVFFLMKASPYGAFSHSHADQNSFVLSAYGQPLLISSGYREWYGSNHHNNWNQASISKNTVLVDGKGQQVGVPAPGAAITEFFTGRTFTATTGNAAPAYAPNVLTQFDRRVLSVDGELFILLDELAAPRESRFDWLLHSRQKMNLDAANQGLVGVEDGNVGLDVRFLYPAASQLSFQQTDKFATPIDPAYNYANQWHLTVSTTARLRAQRFLTVLSPYRKGAAPSLKPNLVEADGVLGVETAGLRALFSCGAADKPRSTAGLTFQGRLTAHHAATQQTTWLLLAGTLLQEDQRTLLQASSPVDIELTQPTDGGPATLHVQTTTATTLELFLGRPLSDVQTVAGDTVKVEWRYNELSQKVTLTLPAGAWQLSLL